MDTSTILTNSNAPLSLARSGLGAELRALRAIARREWVIFRRYPTWILAFFIWPIIFPLVYILSGRALAGPDGSGLIQFSQLAGTTNFLGYVAVGTTIWMWQNVVLWGVGFSLRDEQMRGTLESNWLSPTWRFSFLLGTSVVQLITMLSFLLLSAFEFGLFFGVRFNGNPLLALLVILAAIPPIYGLAFAFASLVITVKEAHTFVFLVRGLVMVFCGISFPISLLPGWMKSVAAWLPPTYIIHAMRSALLANASLTDLLPDLKILLVFGLAWLGIGFTLFNWMERRARSTGTIGNY
jgi:ABC-2 type transport system permease protein